MLTAMLVSQRVVIAPPFTPAPNTHFLTPPPGYAFLAVLSKNLDASSKV